MSSLSNTPTRRLSISRAPRAELTISMDAEREGAIPLAEFADIARSVEQTIDRIVRALNDRSGRGRPPAFLKKLSALEAVRIEPGSAVLVIEAPNEMENFPIDFEEADAGVQAIELFVNSLDALGRGEDPPTEIGEPARESLRSFAKAVEGHDRVRIESKVGDTTTTASFAPRLLLVPVEESILALDDEASTEIVGVLYGVNLHTRTYRIEDQLAKTHLLRLAEDLDDRAMGSLLGETVRVRVVPADTEGKGADQLFAVAIERVEPPRTSDYYTWDLEKALEGIEPLRSIEDLAIPGLDGDEADAFWHAVND